jgi:hypothetical protein
MPIIHMIENKPWFPKEEITGEFTAIFPEGAYCPFENNVKNPYAYDRADSGIVLKDNAACGNVIVLYTTHHGLCLFERELNGSSDSDFFMIVWNPEKKEAEEIQFATTRGWCYPCLGSRPDATPEVLEAYTNWKAAQDRRYRVLNRWNDRKRVREFAQEARLTYFQARKVLQAIRPHLRPNYMKLLCTKKFRSGFRAKMAENIRQWARDPSPKYPQPLSSNQERCI